MDNNPPAAAAEPSAAAPGQAPPPGAGAALDPAAWARTAPPEALALAIDLGVRCLQAVGHPDLRLAGRGAQSSAERGARGEEEVYELLARSRRVRDVSRRAHSGDLLCDSAAGPVYVEVKHYTCGVPAAEVEKFLRDLRERDAAAGVLLSLTSPIVGQRGAIAVVLEPRVSAGTLVPVVYAAPVRGAADGRLSHDVALAAVDMAVCLAEVYPRGIRGLHGRDSALAYSVAADQLADGAAAVRTDLARLAGDLAGGAAALGERLVLLAREARELARGQRAEAEEVREAAPDGAEAFVAQLSARYPVRAPAPILARVVRAVEETSLLAGALGEGNRWRLLKSRVAHVHSGCALNFLKGATEVRVPFARLPAERIAAVVKAHPKKVRLADEEIALELDDTTVADALALVDAA